VDPEFFSFLTVAVNATTWFKGVLRNVHHTKFKETVAEGGTVADQAEGIYVADREEISRSFRLHGTPDSQMRNSVIQANGSAGGRPCK
jgi:hypothetical protein